MEKTLKGNLKKVVISIVCVAIAAVSLFALAPKFSDAVATVEVVLSRFIDTVAVLIITTCVIPILVMIFFVIIVKVIFGITIPVNQMASRFEKRRKNIRIPEEQVMQIEAAEVSETESDNQEN